MQLRAFTERDAVEICAWRYPEPYDVYNRPAWNTVQASGEGIASAEKRASEFFAVEESDHLVGFFRLHFRDGELMLGLGMRPDACGQGHGKELLSLAIDTAQKRYGAQPLFLEVRTFNLRAIRCYHMAGFSAICTSERLTQAGTVPFIRMKLSSEDAPRLPLERHKKDAPQN